MTQRYEVRRIDNMPSKVTSHSVRGLTGCKYCTGLGSRDLMLEFTTVGDKYHVHTSCYAERHPDTLYQLSPSNIAKLRIGDFQHLTEKQQVKLFKAFQEVRS